MSAKQSSQVTVKALESNPLAMFERGLKPQATLPRHRRSAAVGNLYFEYAQNVPMLRGIVRSGRQVAEYFESKGLISWDRETDRYIWRNDPISKAEFLQMIQSSATAN